MRQRWATIVAAGAMMLFAFIVLGEVVESPARTLIDSVGSALAALVVAAVLLRTAWGETHRRERAAWGALGLGLLAWGIADTFGVWAELAYGAPPVRPYWTDIGYLVMVPFVLASIVLRSTARPRLVGRLTLLIDSSLVIATAVALAWMLLFGPIVERFSADMLVQALTLAHQVGDVAILCCLSLAMLRDTQVRPATLPLLLGLAGLAVGDATYAALVARERYYIGHPVDVVWFTGLVLIGLAATLEQTRRGRVPRLSAGSPLWTALRLMTPTVLVAFTTLVVLGFSLLRAGAPFGPAESALVIAWLLLLARAYVELQTAGEGQRRERRLRVGHAGSLRRELDRRRQLEAMRVLSTELTREMDLTALLTLITRRAADLSDAPIGIVYLWDPQAAHLVPRAWHGLGSSFGTLRLRRGDGAAGRAVDLGRAVIVNDYPRAREAFRPMLRHTPIAAALAAPIISLGQLVGAIAVADGRTGRDFDEYDLGLLELFAEQAAVAIEHARLIDEAASIEALRELSRLKTELLSTVSHELRTPLTLIHGYAELLNARAARLGPADVEMMADEILLGSRTMIRLVDDLLDFSRMDGSRLQLERSRVDMADLLRRHVHAWRGQVGGERLRLDAEVAPLEAYADPTRLDQIIRNLISNALSHAPDGPIEVRAYQEPCWVRLEVADRGPGIPSAELPRIWESFFRGERARTSPNRGSGLGLAVVRQLVELHGGRVDVVSEPGHGATFKVWLPVVSHALNGQVEANGRAEP